MRLTQMYNGICSAWVNVEHILFLSVSNRGFLGSVVCIVGIGFASLAHPCLVVLCKKSATTYRCLHLIFVSLLLV